MNKVRELGTKASKINLWIVIIGSIHFTAFIAWTSFLVLNKQLLLGQMMALITLVTGLQASVISIVMANISYQEACIAFNRLFEFAFTKSEYNEKDALSFVNPDNQMTGLCVNRISFRFPGKKPLLKEINFTIEKGEIITFFGEVGCGKSTLLNLLLRFYPFESGSLSLNNMDSKEWSLSEWRQKICKVPQHVKLFQGTVLENIAMRECPDTAGIVQFCRDYGFHSFIVNLPQGYATIVGPDNSNLSGGQRQLIAIACALYHCPQILLLDEATAAMDRRTEKFVFDLLKRLKKEMSFIIVTHRPQLAKFSDRIYVIENNTISCMGDHNTLISTNHFYRESFMECTI
jgi:ATP-binding cassette subfamily B protein